MNVPVVDIHVHLAGLGYPDTGCFIRPRLRRTLPVLYLFWREGIPFWGRSTYPDDAFARRLTETIEASNRVDYGVTFAFDAVYETSGRRDERRTLLYTPNDHLLAVCDRYPNLLPGVSIHPYRPDALDELERCREGGAVAVKWLPSVQCMDPADTAIIPFYERLAESRLPLIVHTGWEHTLPATRRELEHPERLRLPLEMGVEVVAAHASSLGHWHGREGFYDRIALSLEFPNLWSDISGMAIPLRGRHLATLAAIPHLQRSLVHGSDYPVPTLVAPFCRLLGREQVRTLRQLDNPFDLDLCLKEALGFTRSVFERGYHLLRRVRGPGRDRLPPVVRSSYHAPPLPDTPPAHLPDRGLPNPPRQENRSPYLR